MDSTGMERSLSELIVKYRRTLETDRRFLLEQFGTSHSPARSSVLAASAPVAGLPCLSGEFG